MSSTTDRDREPGYAHPASTHHMPGRGAQPGVAASSRASSVKHNTTKNDDEVGAESAVDGDGAAGPRLYTPAEAAKLLTVRESWLRRQAGQRRIPCTMIGRHLRFSRRDVDAIIAAGARPPKAARGRPRTRRM